MQVVDVDGLSLLPTRQEREQYALALGYNSSEFITDRIAVLKQLTTDYGNVIITGPIGAQFFCLSSPENFIEVVPDGYRFSNLTTDINEWSYRALDVSSIELRYLLKSTPTPRHRLYSKYQEAAELRAKYQAATAAQAQERKDPENITIIRDPEQQLSFLDSLTGTFVCDLEWVISTNQLIAISVSTTEHNYYLPVLGAGFDITHTTPLLVSHLWAAVRRCTTIWHNAKADIKSQYPSDPLELSDCDIHDTILMAYVAGERVLGLKDLIESKFNERVVHLPKDLETLPVELAARYAAGGDTANTLRLFNLFSQTLHATDQWSVYNDIERPLVTLIASMERYGIPLDINEVRRLRDQYAAEEDVIADRTSQTHPGVDIRRDSDQKLLLSRLGLHTNTLDKRALSKSANGSREIQDLLSYRGTRTLRRNFLDKHIAAYESSDGVDDYRVYPSFNQAGRDTDGGWTNAPATGRLSSSGPNLQNQPRSIRSCFVPPSGYKLVSLDYSALELRLAAAISEDPVMLSVLQGGGDLHQYMRDVILKETGVDVGRPTAKTANFNLRYGGQADMLVTIAANQGAHLDYDTAASIVEVDRNTYVGYWLWFSKVVAEARRNGFSGTLFGRRRYNSDLLSSDQLKRGHAERAAANMVIQGTGADVIKMAMRRLIPILKYFNAHLALQVHDELVFWVPEAVANRFIVAARGIMESISIPHLNLIVEGGVGNNWAEVH